MGEEGCDHAPMGAGMGARMPLIDYSVLRDLLAEFDALTSDHSDTAPDRRQRLEDVQYTLCVYTDVRDPQQAVTRARRLLRQVEAPGRA
jgi:hypothetical protein